MTQEGAKVKIDKYAGRFGNIKGFELTIGKLISGDDTDCEPMGPTPKPEIASLRDWFMRIIDRYPPFYMSISDVCELCTFGKCNLAKGRRGACGIDLEGAISK